MTISQGKVVWEANVVDGVAQWNKGQLFLDGVKVYIPFALLMDFFSSFTLFLRLTRLGKIHFAPSFWIPL